MTHTRWLLALLTPLLIAPGTPNCPLCIDALLLVPDSPPCPECWEPSGLWLPDGPCASQGCDVVGVPGLAQMEGTLLWGEVSGASFEVSKGTRVVATLWSEGADADLYLVTEGSKASFSSWDCRPYLAGEKTEICSFTAQSDGEASFMVHAWSGKVAYEVHISAL
jgi:hypothetical protein